MSYLGERSPHRGFAAWIGIQMQAHPRSEVDCPGGPALPLHSQVYLSLGLRMIPYLQIFLLMSSPFDLWLKDASMNPRGPRFSARNIDRYRRVAV